MYHLRRFWGTHGKRRLVPEQQLRDELNKLSMTATLTRVQIGQATDVKVRVASGTRGASPLHRNRFSVEFTTSEPVCGPIALGHSCHFGLGLFVPAS
jgi:CRISPR-associated protein Csb2